MNNNTNWIENILNYHLNAEIFVTILIKAYLKKTNKTAFTYSGLRNYYYKNKIWKKHKYDWHTIERIIRKLANKGILERIKLRHNKVIFQVDSDKLTEHALYNLFSSINPTTLSDGRIIVNMFGRYITFKSREELFKSLYSLLEKYIDFESL